MFQERLNPTTSCNIIKTALPTVVINPNAIAKMQVLVEECNEEVGWLGTAIFQNNVYYIEDVMLFKQEVHATTTEISPEGLASFGEELLQHPNGVEIWNNIKVWGHSHVNMSISPSGQDDKQMLTFQEGGHDWFIRIIANKKGDLKVDVYNFAQGITYIDIPWEEMISIEEEKLLQQISLLTDAIDKIKGGRLETIKPKLIQEIKDKVTRKSYNQVGFQTSYGNVGSAYNKKEFYGNYEGYGAYDAYDGYGTFCQSNQLKKKEEEEKANTPAYKDALYIEDYEDIFTFFEEDEIEIFRKMKDPLEVREWVEKGWPNNSFTDGDINKLHYYSKIYYLRVKANEERMAK